MQLYELKQVLWVEDDPNVIETYPLMAEQFDLELVHFPCWDDAKIALEYEFDRWSAIILDAKCKYHRDSADNAIVFLREALDDISTICENKGRIIPWYVLTGGDDSEVSDSINDKRLKWDKDWTDSTNKKYYSKNMDNEMLYRRIRYHAKESPRLQMQKMYNGAIEQLEAISSNASEIILDILESMHYPDFHKDFNPILYYNQLRQILEYVFRKANEVGVIPDVCISTSDEVNLNQCCLYLCGKNADILHIRYGNPGERLIPKHIQDMMFLILTLGNINSHTSKLTNDDERSLDLYFHDNVFNSRYLIYSLTLQTCEIVMWMNRYIETHPNKEENMKKCVRLDEVNEEKDNNILDDDLIGVVEFHDSIYHIGSKFMLNPAVVEKRGWLGKKVKIIKYDKNKQKSKDQYPFFAYNIQPL